MRPQSNPAKQMDEPDLKSVLLQVHPQGKKERRKEEGEGERKNNSNQKKTETLVLISVFAV